MGCFQARCRPAFAGMLVLTSLSLAACSHHAPSSSQVVAQVNDREITISQLNQALNAINPDTLTPGITRRAIDTLVDEELLVQAALANKLDRDPATVAAMEHARRQILAQTYAERLLYPKAAISLADEEKYYRSHPGLFENRRVYSLTVYTLQQSDMSALLKSDLNGTHSAEQVRSVLEKHQVKYETQNMSSPAEDLPLGKIEQFASAGAGDLLIADEPDGKALLICVLGFDVRPLSFEAAKASIDQYLTKRRNTEAIQEHVRAERGVARISYAGQFSQYFTPSRK